MLDRLVEAFCEVDDFRTAFQPQCAAHQIDGSYQPHGSKPGLVESGQIFGLGIPHCDAGLCYCFEDRRETEPNMSDRFRQLQGAVVIFSILVAVYCLYAHLGLILPSIGIILCMVTSLPIVMKLQSFSVSGWHPNFVRAILIVLFALADILIALVVWVSSQAPRMDLALDGFGASAVAMIVAEFNRLTAVLPLVARSIMFDLMAIATCLLFLGLYVRNEGGFPRYRSTSNLVTLFVSHATIVLVGTSGAFVAFGLIGLPHYDVLAAIVGAGSLIPVAGSLAASAICGAVAMSLSASKAVATISYLIVYYELDSKVLRPHQADADFILSTLAVLVCLMLGMVVGGFTSALIGIGPVALVLLLIASRLEIDRAVEPQLDICAKCDLARKLTGSRDFEVFEARPVVYTHIAQITPTSIPFELALRVLTTGVITLVVLEFLHVRYPLILASLAGTGNLVPIIGPLAATFACAVVAGADSTSRLIAVLVFFLIFSQVVPLLSLKKTHLSYFNLQVLAVPTTVFLGVVAASIAISTIVVALTAGACIWWALAKNSTAAKSRNQWSKPAFMSLRRTRA